MGIAYHPHRLAPLYGLIISLLPVAAVLQEFWWHQHPLQAAAFIFLLAAMVYYALREYQQELGTGGHEGGHGLVRSAHLVMVAIFALGCFGAWRLLYTFAFGHPGWHLPEIIPSDSSTYVDIVVYTTAFALLLAIYWLGHRFPRVKFDFYLRWRWKLWDIVIIIFFGVATAAGLMGYMSYFAGTHAPMTVFGAEAGKTPIFAYWLLGVVFALANALVEEFWFRGLLMGALKPLLPMWRVILIQAIVFGLFHWFGTPQGILGVLLAGVWGGLLGWWVYARGSLWPAVVVHFLADILIFAYTN
jgi:membrane protease YdiL (CAAX protease family)